MERVSSFPERLRELVGRQSYEAFGKQVGLSKQSISAYMRGLRNPKPTMIRSMSMQLNVTPAWLMGYDAPKRMQKPATLISRELSTSQKELIYAVPDLTPEQADVLLELVDLLRKKD